ncbi:pentatricopeptide repeat-containing protein At4g21065-like [Gastrolobium bilobum]|uniref:pentatricopeptide repeat-containing protein At4g21065-like n=1 Tax=Gastrolobium bilobum TaxID=150636 RepID=UPI002AB2BFDF|nr:pentatricopeptide repeat-containing protein At4g21065-like [Gastrolobium bilobum]
MLCSTFSHQPQILTIQKDTQNLQTNFNTPFELKQAHALLIKTNASLSNLPLTRVALVCALTPSFSYAHQILHRSEIPEIVTWNTCLKIFAESDSPQHAIFLFRRLRQMGTLPDHFTCSFVLKACTHSLDIVNGRIVHGYVEKLGFQSNLILQNMVIHLYAMCGEMGDARLLFDKMTQRDVVTWNIMISQLIKVGDVGGAYELFSLMPQRNVRSWTSMISGFVQCGKSEEAVDLFLEMEREGLNPNVVTVVAVLAACADLGDLEFGRNVHWLAIQNGFRGNVHVCNTLIDMYVKCGCMEEGYKVFDAMRERSVVSWSIMIAGFAVHGKGEKALELYGEMIRSGIKPNHVTFTGLLHACSHMGLVDKGREFFTIMTQDYGIEPKIEHYGCLIDLFSRAGLLKEAHEVILNMPMSPNGVIWGALLGGCRLHKNTELAEEAMRHISKLDPLNDGYYVVLSNIYAEAGKWEEVAKIRILMKNRGVKKTPGFSRITIDGVVHEFVAGDETHPQAEQIFEMWAKLLVKMKVQGYIPNTSLVLLDVEDEQKVKFLFRHSEKLALVYGLMNTKPGMPIRIMKNLRVCEDCHVAFKLLSAIENREIVLRDRNRFHCFKNGICTCKDYW